MEAGALPVGEAVLRHLYTDNDISPGSDGTPGWFYDELNRND